MKRKISILAGLCVGAAALLSAADNPNGKNYVDVEYRSLPADYWNLLTLEPGKWNSNFRPYDPQSAAMLWSDSTLQRSVALDADESKTALTAILATCDDAGFTILVYAGEPRQQDELSAGNSRPNSMLECFFQPGDADSSDFSHYYHFLCQATAPYVYGVFPWLMEDRTFRTVKGWLTVDSHTTRQGNMLLIRTPWEPLFDRLPFFTDKKDDIWRLSVIRWASTGGQTWGGNVHQQTTAGYLRFPKFTEVQQTAIMKHVLLGGWDRFQNTLSQAKYSLDLLPVNSMKHYVRDLNRLPHTFLAIAEDKEFRDIRMKPMVEERKALGKKIADLETLPFAEQIAFYKKASDMLYNFEYELQSAYGDWQKDQIFDVKEQ